MQAVGDWLPKFSSAWVSALIVISAFSVRYPAKAAAVRDPYRERLSGSRHDRQEKRWVQDDFFNRFQQVILFGWRDQTFTYLDADRQGCRHDGMILQRS